VQVGDLSASRDIDLVSASPWEYAQLERVSWSVQALVNRDSEFYWTGRVVYLTPDRDEKLIGDEVSSADKGWLANTTQTIDGNDWLVEKNGGLRFRLTKNGVYAPTLSKLFVEYVLRKGALPEN
jgi:hypothetical protein